MSKKITSVLILVAAVLLSLSSYAQIQKALARRTAATDKQKTEMRTLNQDPKARIAEMAKQKEQALKAAGATGVAGALETTNALNASSANVEGVKTLKQMTLASHKGAPVATLTAPHRVLSLNDYAVDGQYTSRFAATTDSHGIITAPDEGEHKYYTRAGGAFYVSGQSVVQGVQSGIVEIVETADGTVYIKDLISRYTQGTWVKGTKSGNTITIAPGQPVYYSTQYFATVSIHNGTRSGNTYTKASGNITLTINGNVISLDNTDVNHIIAAFWDDDNTFGSYGDYETVWTLDEGYTPPSTELVTLPEGVEVLDWYAEGSNYYGSAAHTVPENVKVAFDGNDVYVKGIFTNMPNAWIKGTINGTTATFPTLQYIGLYGGSMDMWLYVADSNSSAPLDAATFTYDAAAQTLTLDEDQMLFANAASDRIYYLEYIDALTLSAEKPVYELIELPEGAEAQTWYAEGLNDDGNDVPYTAQVAFVDNDVYVKGIFTSMPNAWIKGTLEGSTVTFPPLQYLGDYQTNHIWTYAASVDEEAGTYVPLDAVTFTYDVVEKTLTMDDNQVLAANAAKNRLYYLEYIKSLTLSGTPPPLPTAPYEADFTKSNTMRDFTILDNNGDGRTWAWSASNYAYYTYHTSNAADDYLILPIDLEAGKYSVTINAASYSERYPEKFEVVVGKDATPEALNITAIEESTVASNIFTDYEGEFITDKAGTYYVAIHAISDKNEWYLKVKSLSIEVVPQPTAPAAPVLTMEAGENGALSAAGTLTAPATTINGDELKKNITKIEIWCDNALLTTYYDIAPGSTKKIIDEPQTRGLHTYYAVPYNSNGVGQKSEKIAIWVGPDAPTDVENVQVTGMPAADKLSMAWDEVKALNDGYLDPATVQYDITTIDLEDFMGWFTIPYEGETIGSVVGETTATVDYPVDEGEPRYEYFGVKAIAGGDESDPCSWFAYALIGAPYELPIEEHFTGSAMHYVWDYNEITALGVSQDGSDGDVALALTADEAGQVMFASFKLNTAAAAKPTLVFDAKKGTSSTDKLSVYAAKPDGTIETIEEVTLTDAYQTFKVVIPADYAKERWTQVGFTAYLPEDGDNILLDNIKVLDLYEYDLSVAVSAPTSVNASKAATIKATVKNEGEFDATGYTVTIKANDEVLLDTIVNEALKMFATAEFTAELTTTIFDDNADINITATVEFANDLNEDNNEATAIITLKESTAPAVTSVSAWSNDNRVITYWTAPVLEEGSIEEVTEDVEAYEEFDTGGLTEDNLDENYGKIGEWTVYDGNREFGYGFNSITVPHLGEPNAWMVMNPASSQNSQDLSSSHPAHSGSQYFISTCVAESEPIADTDHWLISPELPGVAQTISFFASVITDQYGAEEFEVLASTTDANVESFTLVQTETTEAIEWTEYTFDLPAGTKYFAIRHTSNDIFGLKIDDITYSAGGAALEIDHYNIYLDGELATEATVNQALATIEDVENGDHTVGVSVVYTNGQESKPVTAIVTVTSTTTGLETITVLTQPVDVYTIDGKLVRKQTTTLNGLKGVYVVDGKKVVVK